MLLKFKSVENTEFARYLARKLLASGVNLTEAEDTFTKILNEELEKGSLTSSTEYDIYRMVQTESHREDVQNVFDDLIEYEDIPEDTIMTEEDKSEIVMKYEDLLSEGVDWRTAAEEAIKWFFDI